MRNSEGKEEMLKRKKQMLLLLFLMIILCVVDNGNVHGSFIQQCVQSSYAIIIINKVNEISSKY